MKGKKRTEEKRQDKRIFYLFLRYVILFFLGLNLWLLYFIFTPLTIYPVFFMLSLLFHASLSGNIIIFNNTAIKLVNACIAGSAYYLLLILNLTIPITIKKRLQALIFSLTSFLAINIIRIFLFSLLFLASFTLFNLTHLLFWYLLSAFIVFFIWLLTIKIFKIKEIPVYSDVRNLIFLITGKNK